MSNEQDTNHTDLSRRRLLGAGFALSGLALAGCATAPDSAGLADPQHPRPRRRPKTGASSTQATTLTDRADAREGAPTMTALAAPRAWVRLPAIPHLPNGKPDRAAARALAACKAAEYWILGTVAEEGATSLRELAARGLPDALVVVLGSEERGLRRLTRESCDFLATIPGAGGVASLNVSAAAAVTLSCVA